MSRTTVDPAAGWQKVVRSFSVGLRNATLTTLVKLPRDWSFLGFLPLVSGANDNN